MGQEERKARLADLKAVVRRKNSSWWIAKIEKEIIKRWPGELNSAESEDN